MSITLIKIYASRAPTVRYNIMDKKPRQKIRQFWSSVLSVFNFHSCPFLSIHRRRAQRQVNEPVNQLSDELLTFDIIAILL